jgi:hypothetical protein
MPIAYTRSRQPFRLPRATLAICIFVVGHRKNVIILHPSIHRLFSPNLALASSFEVFYLHTIRHTVGLLWTTDQPVAETSTYTRQHNI